MGASEFGPLKVKPNRSKRELLRFTREPNDVQVNGNIYSFKSQGDVESHHGDSILNVFVINPRTNRCNNRCYGQ